MGFATNMRLIGKPGAMQEMAGRGYKTILLRDCTTAVENEDTVKELLMTRVFIDWIEMTTVGYTATSEAFIKACERICHMAN